MGSLFSAPKPPPLPPPPPPPVTRADPAIAEAGRKRRQAEKQRQGRRASVVAGNLQTEAPLGRAEAGSQTLG